MPTVKVNGKIKHFPYNANGRIKAQMASKEPGAVMYEVMNRKKKVQSRHGISNLKRK